MNAAPAVSLNPETAARAAQVAKARGESLEAFVEHALNEAIEEQSAFEEAMAEADRDFEEGRVVSHEEVLKWLAESRARAEAEIARRSSAS